MSLPQQQGSTIHPSDSVLSSSSAHIFRTLSVSANNIGDSTTSGQMRTPRGSIIFFDDHFNDQSTATYLLGPPLPPPPTTTTDETNLSRLSSFNLTSMSRSHLSHIDEEKISPYDPYTLLEPLSHQNSPQSTSIITLNNPVSLPAELLDYVDLILPSTLNTESSETNEQQLINNSDEISDESNESQDQEYRNNLSTDVYTEIDFHQTQRRDRIVQYAAKAKMEDQTPPFNL
jgi:hypothetical protein